MTKAEIYDHSYSRFERINEFKFESSFPLKVPRIKLPNLTKRFSKIKTIAVTSIECKQLLNCLNTKGKSFKLSLPGQYKSEHYLI